MPTRRDIRRSSRFTRRRRWPKVLAFLALFLAAGLLTVYALSQSDADGAPLPGATPTAAAEPAPLAEKVPQIDILGDSYVAGSAEGGKGAENWTKVVGSRFYDQGTRVELNVMAQPGSGYLARGSTDLIFREAATLRLRPTADVVVVFGSRNDGRQTPDAMYTAARSLYSDIRDIAPEAKVVVVGPIWVNGAVPSFITANNAEMKQAAADEGIPYIDALSEEWLAGANEGLIGLDGIHPTDEGHAYLAEKLFPLIEERLPQPAPAG